MVANSKENGHIRTGHSRPDHSSAATPIYWSATLLTNSFVVHTPPAVTIHQLACTLSFCHCIRDMTLDQDYYKLSKCSVLSAT
jgi:hypothetical protein